MRRTGADLFNQIARLVVAADALVLAILARRANGRSVAHAVTGDVSVTKALTVARGTEVWTGAVAIDRGAFDADAIIIMINSVGVAGTAGGDRHPIRTPRFPDRSEAEPSCPDRYRSDPD